MYTIGEMAKKIGVPPSTLRYYDILQKNKAAKMKQDLDDLKEIIREEGSEMKEEARAKLLDQLDRLERALAKEDDIDDQFEEA